MNLQTTTPESKAGDENSPRKPAAPAGSARAKWRHLLLLISFLLLVLIPSGLSFGYLYLYAKDQYGSTLGFSVRSEELTNPLELLGGLGQLSSGSSTDSDILYEYIQSQKLVEQIDATIDLQSIYSKVSGDPVFAYDPAGSIEDLVEHWGRMVDISYDNSTQLMEIVAKAFTPEDAQTIAQEIQRESTELINRLNLAARKDATRYAKEELDRAVERLKKARAELTQFRTTTRIIDPSVDLLGQMGVVNQLEQQLASALIELDLLTDVTTTADPRAALVARRIEVIRNRIDAERVRMAGDNGQGEGTLSTLVGDFERLMVEREFTEKSYLAALSTYDIAQSEAQRQSRYLAAYVEPTLAETSQFPKRELIGTLISMLLFFGWSILVLIVYSLRDRR